MGGGGVIVNFTFNLHTTKSYIHLELQSVYLHMFHSVTSYSELGEMRKFKMLYLQSSFRPNMQTLNFVDRHPFKEKVIFVKFQISGFKIKIVR